MRDIDLSIIIVHAFCKDQIRQTLRGIYRVAPRLNFEIIVVDNTPEFGMKTILDEHFSQVRYLCSEKNVGFGAGMNIGIGNARGRHILIFNPDIVVAPGSLEELVNFLDTHPDVGIVGPKLLNPDGSLQYSCYRFPTLMIPAYRRTFLGKFNFGRRAVEDYLMMNDDHGQTMEVDSLIGAALLARRAALDKVGLFDERFFMYFEDNDLCRRFWEKGLKVIYHPTSVMTHYHRRASADGNFIQQLLSKYAWIQIHSALKFFLKYRGRENPREKSKLEV